MLTRKNSQVRKIESVNKDIKKDLKNIKITSNEIQKMLEVFFFVL
jgi:hypothetical protein